jgi:hypothetical protein
MSDSRRFSVNEEIALDPAIATRVGDLQLMLAKVGFYEGRFLSRFPKRWASMALEAVDGDVNLTRVRVLLERAKESAFVPSGRPYNSGMRWVENAISQNQISPFAGIVAIERRQGCVAIDDLDISMLPGSRDIRIVPSRERLLSLLRPLVRSSGSLYLVDPYFKPWLGNTRRLLCDFLAEAFSSRCISFSAFVSIKGWYEELSSANEKINSVLAAIEHVGRSLRFVVCDDLGTAEQLHARYLFSERGGIRLDRGFQTGRVNSDFSVIDKGVHDELMKTFVERPLPFPVTREYRITS